VEQGANRVGAATVATDDAAFVVVSDPEVDDDAVAAVLFDHLDLVWFADE